MDTCPYDAGDDYDSDLVCGNYDSCRRDVHDDTDSDLVCADSDACPLDALDDTDSCAPMWTQSPRTTPMVTSCAAMWLRGRHAQRR